MIRKLLTPIILLLLFSLNIQAQENKITISHPEMKGWSSVIVKTERKGKFIFNILDSSKTPILTKNLSISDNKTIAFKYNFGNFESGTYTFQLLAEEKVIYSKSYPKK